MKTCKYHHPENDVEIEYYFYKAKAHSNVLVVSFPAPGGQMQGGAWGYMITLRKFGDVNILFPMSNREYSKSRLTYRNGKPEIEDAMMGLVRQCIKEANCDYIVALGSSMGGWCALYYGLKYNWNIIAGSPGYTFKGNKENALYAFGDASEENIRKLDSLLSTTIQKAGELGYKKKIFIAYGEGESSWRNVASGPSLLKRLRESGIEVHYDLYPFSDHNTIGHIFPQILSLYLRWLLGQEPFPLNVKMDIISSPKNKLIDGIKKSFFGVISVMKENLSVTPFLDIKYSDVWERRLDSFPKEVARGNSFGDLKRENGDFAFQLQLLEYAERENNNEVLLWLVDNVEKYFAQIEKDGDVGYRKLHVRVHMTRAVFFIRFHKICNNNGINKKIFSNIPIEIKKCLKYMGSTWINASIGNSWEYRTVLSLLYMAMYFKNEKELSSALVLSALEMEKLYNEYFFGYKGCCVGGQLNLADYFAKEILNIGDFLKLNEIEYKNAKARERKTQEIMEYVSHISGPNNILATIGHTMGVLRRTRKRISRLQGNYINCKCNIAFLEDNLSYITINGGSNVHTKIKHCDLLSFTWNYSNNQIFCDAGGAKGRCEEFASSAVAHNAFICDDYDYIIPDYEDFTCMNEANETDEFVTVSMSHRLIDGVEMKRYFMWIKPNIIIVVDDGVSEEQHEYTQNFILGDFEIDKEGNHVRVNVSKNDYVDIVQHLNEPSEMEEYRGTANPDEDNVEKLRGSLIQSWKKPYHGLNLAYTKKSDKARFVTSIECHSSKVNGQEYHVSSVQKNKEGDYEICLKENEKKYVICVGDTGL